MALLAVALAACGPGDGDQAAAPPTAESPGEATDGTISVWADDLEFSTEQIEAPAGEPFTIEFENREGAPHNIAIYTDESRSEALFVGEVISGPETITYEVPALEAGEYHFLCDIHPQMNGTVIVEG